MRKFLFIGVAGLMIATSMVVAAQTPQSSESSPSSQTTPSQQTGPRHGQRAGREGQRARHLDKNMDGQISRDEWQRNDVFDQLDTNKDGLLSRDELRAGAGRMGGRMDRDHNRQISASEWKGTPEDFKRLDVNGDGILTKDELKVRRRTR